jgi:hypothetical protein
MLCVSVYPRLGLMLRPDVVAGQLRDRQTDSHARRRGAAPVARAHVGLGLPRRSPWLEHGRSALPGADAQKSEKKGEKRGKERKEKEYAQRSEHTGAFRVEGFARARRVRAGADGDELRARGRRLRAPAELQRAGGRARPLRELRQRQRPGAHARPRRRGAWCGVGRAALHPWCLSLSVPHPPILADSIRPESRCGRVNAKSLPTLRCLPSANRRDAALHRQAAAWRRAPGGRAAGRSLASLRMMLC